MSIGIAIGIAILLNQEYRYRYHRYFFEEMSISVSAILILSIDNNPDVVIRIFVAENNENSYLYVEHHWTYLQTLYELKLTWGTLCA
jgi:hypothetical protein